MRISQHFENQLPADRRHAELLHKMTIEIPGVRPQILSDRTAELLGEIIRFRHFRRYYYALDYDWRRLDALIAVFADANSGLMADLEGFLSKLAEGEFE